nr:hypothetical protein [Tanacetum cinerariifolium]
MPRQPARGPPVGSKPKSTFVYRPVSTKKRQRIMGIQSNLVDEEDGGGNQTASTNATPLVANINELKREMLDEKLVLVNEHGKPLEIKVTNEASASKPSTFIGGPIGRI